MKSIQSQEEYFQMCKIVEKAEEALHFGYNERGIHYSLSWILRGYQIYTFGRNDAVREGKLLLKEYEKENYR